MVSFVYLISVWCYIKSDIWVSCNIDTSFCFLFPLSFAGVDPMGLFWCLVPDPSGSQNIRLVVKRVEQSLTFVFSVYLGHLSLQELHTSNNPVCMTNVTRTFMAPGVRRLEVRDGRLRGILYLPPGLYHKFQFNF